MVDFFKQIETKTDHGLSVRSYRTCSFVNEDFVSEALQEKAIAVNWYAFVPKKSKIVSGSAACLYALILFEGLLLRAIKQ